ncbi:MAG TPA: homoserine O-acetyltransferase [Gaiellaceae bacterium]|nr:homoserine O-acetyltransferase [Gaiellaceae bacterium]
MIVETQYLDLPEPLALDCGRVLRDVRIAYETYGELDENRDNTLLICHALSGDAHAAGETPGVLSAGELETTSLGWWDAMIGPGRAFDTDRFHVVSTNLIGGCRGSTGPGSIDPDTGKPYGADFPELTVADLVRAQKAFLDALGIPVLAAVAGASLGGMQALQFAIDYPDFVRNVVAIASTKALDTQGVALNAAARNAIRLHPDPREGMRIARQIGHITYLSRESIRSKSADGRFGVESYLDYQADKFVQRFDPNTYLLFSTALTRFELDESRLGDAKARFLLLSFSSDWIYPPADSDALLESLRAAGLDARHVSLETSYGHDAFLLEAENQAPHIRSFLS